MKKYVSVVIALLSLAFAKRLDATNIPLLGSNKASPLSNVAFICTATREKINDEKGYTYGDTRITNQKSYRYKKCVEYGHVWIFTVCKRYKTETYTLNEHPLYFVCKFYDIPKEVYIDNKKVNLDENNEIYAKGKTLKIVYSDANVYLKSGFSLYSYNDGLDSSRLSKIYNTYREFGVEVNIFNPNENYFPFISYIFKETSKKADENTVTASRAIGYEVVMLKTSDKAKPYIYNLENAYAIVKVKK